MKRFAEVAPGVLRGGAPTEEEVGVLKHIWGVKRIISLDLEEGEKIDPECVRLGIEHIIIPIEHDTTYSSESRMRHAIKFLSDNIIPLLTEKQPVYIHCIHGRDRTGLAVALYRIKGQHWPLDKVMKEVQETNCGQGMSQKHYNLLMNTIKSVAESEHTDQNNLVDSISPDVVSKSFDSILRGNITGPTNGSYYTSPITPIQDFVMEYPKSSTSPESFCADDGKIKKIRSRKRKMRKIKMEQELKDHTDQNNAMSFVGVRDDVAPFTHYTNPISRTPSPEGISPAGVLGYGNYYL